MSSSIKDKTVRPGSLKGYSYYYSGQKREVADKETKQPKTKKRSRKPLIFLLFAVLVAGFWFGFRDGGKNSSQQPVATQNATAATASVSQATGINNCDGNTLDKLIKISVSQKRMWACEQDKSVRSSYVITGLKDHPETETPPGTYKIYAKTTNTTLKGSDSRGSWSFPVYYWMPFLDNQYGTYGFHDATWRSVSDFGKVGPESEDASHGCVELPLANSKWLYEWAPVGTTVTVES